MVDIVDNSTDNIKQAITILSNYYCAMNSHNVELALSFLDDEVQVSFPENDRNWSSLLTAKEKFSGMFTRMPTFRGEFEVLNSGAIEGESVVINVKCKFSCVATGMDSTRCMRYLVMGGKLKEIDHL